MPRRIALALPLAGLALPAAAQAGGIHLFKVVSARDEVTIGFTSAELAALGSGPEAERIARKLVSDGQISAWQYIVGRAPDGSTRYATTRRIAILRQDTYRIEPFTAALPVATPPAE